VQAPQQKENARQPRENDVMATPSDARPGHDKLFIMPTCLYVIMDLYVLIIVGYL